MKLLILCIYRLGTFHIGLYRKLETCSFDKSLIFPRIRILIVRKIPILPLPLIYLGIESHLCS